MKVRDCQKSVISIKAFINYEAIQQKLHTVILLHKELLRVFESGISSILEEEPSLIQIYKYKEQILNTLDQIEPIEENIH